MSHSDSGSGFAGPQRSALLDLRQTEGSGYLLVTSNLTIVFALLGGLLMLAFAANRLSRWTRVPA